MDTATETPRRMPSSQSDMFFESLASSGHQPLLKHASGRIRFDVIDGGSTPTWMVSIEHGHVDVSKNMHDADAVVWLDKQTLDGLTSGGVNAIAATLRGDLRVEGDLGLVLLFQRLFPAPPTPSK